MPVDIEQEQFDSSKDTSQRITKRRLSGFWLMLAVTIPVLILLAGGAYGVNRVVTDSSLCGTCHEMRPEYYTWQASSHSQIKCTDCHLPTDPWQRVIREFNGLRQVVEHYTGTVPANITIRQSVSNNICLSCHSKNRVANLPGDLIMSHTLHDQHNVQCINCHNGVVHGKIEERGVVGLADRSQWTAEMGKAEAVVDYTAPTMLQCLTCHRQWKVTTQCEKCHRKIPTPPSHQPGTWMTMHGQAAWNDVNQCSMCHYDARLKYSFNKQAVADYIRANQFCYNCHSKTKPPSHDFDWAHDHALQVVRGQVPYCITCHDIDKPDANSPFKGNGIYCNQCHGHFYVGEILAPKIQAYNTIVPQERHPGLQ